MNNIKQNIEEIKENIKKYSPYPEKVKFIAVTKYVDTEMMEKLLDLGINTFGENKAQVIKEKEEIFKDKNINWHFIGNLQKNKVKYIAPFISLIHSVNKLSLAEEIDKRARANNRIIDVLIEINISGEESKEGYIYADFLNDIESLKKLKNINIKGLMTMAPKSTPAVTQAIFAEMYSIQAELNRKYFDGKLTELSMGMTNDYIEALKEGATLIRVGRKIYE